MRAIQKILVVRLSSIGDIILTTPLLRCLKTVFPAAHITYVIKKQYADLVVHSPYIDEIITFDKKDGMAGLKKIKQQLQHQAFDIYLDIHKNWRSRFLRSNLGATKITTYKKLIFQRTLLIWFKINLYGNVRPVYERYFDAVKSLGIKYDGNGTELRFPDEQTVLVKAMITRAGYDFKRPLVILCPSATYFNKRWIPEGFVETAQYLIRKKSAFIIVHGGPEDNVLCTQIAASVGDGCMNTAGKLSLLGSAALLHMSSLVIANDSGLMHMAQSQKRPVIGIYGPTTRELGYFPIDQNSTVIETRLPCRPCTHNGLDTCPKKHFRCMKDIAADRVIKAALSYLP